MLMLTLDIEQMTMIVSFADSVRINTTPCQRPRLLAYCVFDALNRTGQNKNPKGVEGQGDFINNEAKPRRSLSYKLRSGNQSSAHPLPPTEYLNLFPARSAGRVQIAVPKISISIRGTRASSVSKATSAAKGSKSNESAAAATAEGSER